MSDSIFRDVVFIGVLGVGVAFAAANKETIYAKLGLKTDAPPMTVSESESVPAGQALKVKTLPGVAVSIPKSKNDGHFWAEARVNSGMVRFLVDTGASMVALTPEDAVRAGIDPARLTYNVTISTAAGDNTAAYVTLKSVSVGTVTLRNVKALVVPEGLSTSLLGMSFLGELQKVEATPNALLLRL